MSELLKKPNTRGEGWSKVALQDASEWGEHKAGRVVVKTQRQYYCRPLWNGLRKTPLVRREMRALIQLHQLGISVPEVVHYAETVVEGAVEAVLVTEFINGALSFRDAIEQYPESRPEVIARVATLIAQLHSTRWAHGALYPIHILITGVDLQQPNPEVHLIDLEKAKFLGSRRADLARFWRYGHFLNASEREQFERDYKEAMATARTK